MTDRQHDHQEQDSSTGTPTGPPTGRPALPVGASFRPGPIERKPKCSAHRTDGQPCGRYPIRGGRVCMAHGGGAPAVRRAAARRTEEGKVLRLLGREADIEPVLDPPAALARLAGTVEAYRTLLQDRLSELSEVSSLDKFSVERSRVLIELFGAALDRSGKLLVDMARLGIADRQVKVSEAQAEVVVRMLAAAMRQINLPPQSQADLWGVFKLLVAEEQCRDPQITTTRAIEHRPDRAV